MPMKIEDKQMVLEIEDLGERLEYLIGIMMRVCLLRQKKKPWQNSASLR